MAIERIVAEPVLRVRAELGEGALWDAGARVLWWVDIMGQKVHRYDPATGEDRAVDVGSTVGTVVKRKSGGLAVALRSEFAAVDFDKQTVETIAHVHVGGNDIRFNDGKCDPAGRFWAGTMASENRGKLYRLDVDHSVHIKIEGVGCSNGIVWSGDGKTMYYIDTPRRQVWAFDYDVATGEMDNLRTVIEVEKDFGWPDGMSIDSEDRLWIAMWGRAAVCCFDPKTGKQLYEVSVPGAVQSSSCAFGGPGLDELYITSAATGRTEEQAGWLFVAKVPARGVISHEFAG